jgi:hypothetical protein
MHAYWQEPHFWFAWRPIRVSGKWLWLRTVWRWGYVVNGVGLWHYGRISR